MLPTVGNCGSTLRFSPPCGSTNRGKTPFPPAALTEVLVLFVRTYEYKSTRVGGEGVAPARLEKTDLRGAYFLPPIPLEYSTGTSTS